MPLNPFKDKDRPKAEPESPKAESLEEDSLSAALSESHLSSTSSESTTSTSPSDSQSRSATFGFSALRPSSSSLSHSLLPHRHKHHHHAHLSPPFVLPTPRTPVELCELAVTTFLSHPGHSIDALREDLLPQLYHDAYSHRVNLRETDRDGLLETVQVLRSKFRSIRVRFKTQLMDLDGTATIEHAAVALSYDIVATPLIGHKHEIEDKRTSAMGIYKIVDGRIAQGDLVVDTMPFQIMEGTELSCVVM